MARAMKRRSKMTGKPVKPRRHKASKQKRVLAPTETSRLTTSAVGKDEQIARVARERDEALEQQKPYQKCCVSSARPLANWNRFFKPCWREPLASVALVLGILPLGR